MLFTGQGYQSGKKAIILEQPWRASLQGAGGLFHSIHQGVPGES